MKKLYSFFCALIVGSTLFSSQVSAQALMEDFNYAPGALLTANGYTAINAGGTNAITVTAPSLSYPGATPSGVANAITMTTSGEDDTKSFAPTISSGDAYASFLIKVTSAQSGGDYFFSLYDAGGYKARVWIKSTTGGFLFGISKNSTTTTYESTVRNLNTTYLVVLKYTFNSGTTTDDVVSFYVNPSLGDAEPAATIAATNSSGATDAGTIDRIALRQGSSSAAPGLVLDGIRVGTTWASVTRVAFPIISSISPSSARIGDPAFTLTVNGPNFAQNSVIYWNGAPKTTTFVDGTQLTATIASSDLSTAGNVPVQIAVPGTLSASSDFTINPAAGGILQVTSPISPFGNVCLNTSSIGSFTLDGSSLDGTNLTLSSVNGYSYSLGASGPFSSTLDISYTGTSFTGKVVYVIFTPFAEQLYGGYIYINGGGISDYPIQLNGMGVNSAPSVTTNAATSIGATTATAGGNISAQGCSLVSGYGIEYSINSGFPNGTGTPVAASNISGGNFSVNLTGLTPNVRYYYHAYATNSAGTTYGAQQAFNAEPLRVNMGSQTGFTYTENFSDIANWDNFFINGTGANHFDGLSASGSASVPDPNRLTTSTSSFQTGSSGGVQRGTDQSPSSTSIVLLSTGSTDNTSSAAIDLYLDFTGVNAGTLSFDYQSINNSTGDRNGSLRVYGSTDGTTWTEITNVLNFTNNSSISGSKSNIALPASFNNNANARIRFYYYNGTGGTTGSRPKIAIDNLTVTAVATTPCSTPTAAPTALNFGTTTDVSIDGSFTAASPYADHYLVIASTASSLTGNPVDGSNYSVGDVVGEGTVVYNGTGTSFTAAGLNASTTYYFFVFSYNGVCTGGPLYYATALTGQQTTAAGLPPCSTPVGQPTNLQFGATNSNSIQGSFTATTADEYLVLVSTSASLSNNPVNGTAYNVNDVIGNGKVISIGTWTSFTASSLSASTIYYFYVFSLNSQNCVNGPSYNITSALNGSQSTTALPPCTTPSAQPTVLTFNASSNAVSGAFNSGTGADHYLVVRSTSPTLSGTPVDNTDYNAGDNLGGGVVVGNVSGNSFLSTGVAGSTTYYYFIFSENSGCSGGTRYLTTSPLTGSITTSAPITYNYYFGNWHSHSDYSDGNKDHPGYTPADDYTYAQTAQCMDYLGISEHNHFSSPDNPGNTISNYHLGPVQADNYTSTHTGFIAMYGMEWGVISGGGHVVVYGDGMNDLWGWESGSGGWGPTNNYDVYVAKSDYTGASGLFKTVNDNSATNTFASLAHPNQTDFNNIAGTAYNSVADNAIVGTAIESGPATSTNTTYSNPGSSMFYLPYYQTLLSKGYHLGPVVDHDNHNTTFGHTTYSRTAVVASTLSKTELIKGMRNMHFYATEDCDTRVDFSINTRVMGSLFTDRYAPIISVTLTDATTNISSAVIKLMFGVPGSGTLPTAIATATGSSMSFTDENIPNMSAGYYYLDITNGTARIITTPIWYTRNDGAVGAPLPVKLESFGARKQNSSVVVSWKTSQEMNTKEFWIERSLNGKDYQRIGVVKAAGNSDVANSYQFTDGKPSGGDNYYRLRTVDLDTRFEFSKVIKMNFEKAYTIAITPNPASTFIDIVVTNRTELLTLQIADMNGKIIRQQLINADDTRINTTGLSKGFYVVKLEGKSSTYTDKLIIQ
jgi:trimeric autotransporter adhesin